jgi:hypothetical protein
VSWPFDVDAKDASTAATSQGRDRERLVILSLGVDLPPSTTTTGDVPRIGREHPSPTRFLAILASFRVGELVGVGTILTIMSPRADFASIHGRSRLSKGGRH